MDLDPTRYEPNPHPKPNKDIFAENPLYNLVFTFIIFIYIFNPICYDLVFGRYREHPDSDSGDSGSVVIVGKRATVL